MTAEETETMEIVLAAIREAKVENGDVELRCANRRVFMRTSIPVPWTENRRVIKSEKELHL